MSMSDEFYGRVLAEEMEFQFCDICGADEVNWIQIKEDEEGQKIVRFICRSCHDAPTTYRPDTVRTISDPNEFEETIKDSWVDQFIKEQQESGAIHTIDTSEPIPEEEEEEIIELEEEEEQRPLRVANWATAFIQEALFGKDPVKWLEERGAFTPAQAEITCETLVNIGVSQIGPVKESVVRCLGTLLGVNPQVDEKIRHVLQGYANSEDSSISNLAKQYLLLHR